jgi:2-oxo-4-hydroxy-4-carboxy--5-ureidoimidazoline (OHCU) decarboxylase
MSAPPSLSSALLPPVSALSSTADEGVFTGVLDLLFEPSPALHTVVLPYFHTWGFTSYDELIRVVHQLLASLADSTSSSAWAQLDEILGSHPRLGAKKVESTQSRAEQAQLQQNGSSGEAEAEMLKALNDEYEQTFPGLRYVVFVNGRGRSVIMDDMRQRIARGNFYAERLAAISVGDIRPLKL